MIDATTSAVDTTRVPAATAPPAPADKAEAGGHKPFKLFGDEGMTFWDMVDIVNPLQHIPVVSTIYRAITHDELKPGARIAGDTLYGGVIGAAVGMIDSAVEYESGHDIGGNVWAFVTGDKGGAAPDATGTAIANTAAPTTTQVAAAWRNPDLEPGGGGGGKPDLGALSAFTATAAAAAVPTPPPASADFVRSSSPPAPGAEATTSTLSIAPPDSDWRPRAQPMVPYDLPKGSARSLLRSYYAGPTTPPPVKTDAPADAAKADAPAADPAQTQTQAPTTATAAPLPAQADPDMVEKAINDVSQKNQDGQNAWVLDNMQRALDKYQATQRLPASADAGTAGQSVTR